MASFTTEEVDFVKSKGNEYCRQTWLALHDQNTNSETKDEQQIKDFMIDKYERKRYYHDKGLRNGTLSSPPTIQKPTTVPDVNMKGVAFPISPPVNAVNAVNSSNGTAHVRNGFTSSFNGNNSEKTPSNTNDFVADFSTANFVSTPQFSNNSNTTSQPSFANFDNNVIFNSASK